MTLEHFDVIVAGAGPAGSSAAYALSKAGVRTLLIDKQKLPRYKTCGGGVTAKAARALPFDISPVVERRIDGVAFSWNARGQFVRRSQEPLVYMLQRAPFDNLLAEHAVAVGTVLRDETEVTSVEAGDDGVRVVTQRGPLSADYLIGADGATGRVAHSLGLMRDRFALPALESEVEVEPALLHKWRSTMGIDLGTMRAAYGWVFPKGDHLNVGVGTVPLWPDTGARLKAYDSKHTAARVPGVKRVIRSRGYLLPCRRSGSPVQMGRALLVGDAAGLVEPFTGEGIYWAIRSGQIAAESLIAGEVSDYQTRLDAALMPDLMSARHWLGVYVWFPRACYWLPKRVPLFWRAVRAIIRGERHYVDIGRALGPLAFIEDLVPDPFARVATQRRH